MIFFVALVFGLVSGSFLNLIADELAAGKTLGQALNRRRSNCDNCKRKLRWYELIPLLSAIFLHFRCPSCKSVIAWQYSLIEIISGLLAAGFFGFYLEGIISIASAAVGFGLSQIIIAASIIDSRNKSIDEDILKIILAAVLVYHFFVFIPSPQDPAIASLFLGLVFGAAIIAPFVFIARGKLMGEADLIFASIIGLWVGFPAIIVAIMLSFILGGLVGGWLILQGKKKRTDTIGFLPFLAAGGLFAFFFADSIISWYGLGG